MNKPTEKQIEAARIAGDEAWKKWTGGRSSLDGMEAIVRAALSAALAVEAGTGLSVDALAQEIRRVDGNHSLGAGALAEALMPFLAALTPASSAVEGEAFPKPKRKDGGEPCGECHIQPGETCDICGAAHPAPTPAGEWPLEDLTRPIFGIENRTAQEVFDIMADRIRLASPAPQTEGRADG